jgi:hypothetical protein
MLALLTKLSHLVNVDRNMNNTQLIHCAESLVESNEFYMLRMEDFETCFNQSLNGRYGEFYNRLDQPMIFGFLRKYMAERDTAIARQRDNSQQNNIYELFQSEPMQRILNDVHDKLTHKEVVDVPKTERKQDIFQLFLKEWDKLPTEQFDGFNYKIYNGAKFADVNDFMIARLDEVSNDLKTSTND